MKEKLIKIISNKTIILLLVALFALLASLQPIAADIPISKYGDQVFTSYNNYVIFERSFHNLKDNKNLYGQNRKYHWDIFKYTPTFSAFFGLFAMFPFWIGISLWNLLNALILFFAIYYLPRLSKFEKGLVALIILIELMTSMQNEQSNALIAGLIIFSFGLLENKRYLIATLLIVFSIYIKLFGIVGFALFIFYPRKWKLALYSTLWIIVLFLVPLIFVDLGRYIMLLERYWSMLSIDFTVSYGYSMIGWLYSWFCIDVNKYIIVLAGILIFLTPLIRFSEYKNYIFRYLTLTSILIWIVIFNHKAESPTFIIAMAGVALWFIKSKKSYLNIVLFISAIVFTSLSVTDAFPMHIRDEIIIPYTLKAVPCILIWMKIIYDSIVINKKNIPENIKSVE